jgi:(p)ppGpp synthase/HD superfamily hydrolase
MIELTDRFTEALVYAVLLHKDQCRKTTDIPYISHLLGVTALVLEDGGDEAQAIAALLHDAVEDQGGLPTLDDIRNRFGERVAHIVDGCTDSCQHPKPPWRQRKEQYLARLPEESPDVWRVSLADKVHNVRAVVSSLRQEGAAVWERFKGGREGTLWYYRLLADFFQRAYPGFMADELARAVAEAERLAEQFP